MWGDPSALYAAVKSRDARFDGRFFVGVSSTGVFCRPICRVKTPKAENCVFFATAAAAAEAGFRPCRKCRPELAPGASPADASSELARRALAALDENLASDWSLAEIASRLGASERHLRRVFFESFGVTPVKYRQYARLALAKRLLDDPRLKVADAAMAAGFGSLRRFGALFREKFGASPTALRRPSAALEWSQGEFGLTLAYRPPYPWERVLEFLALRAIPGVEEVRDGEYARTARLAGPDGRLYEGWARARRDSRSEAIVAGVSLGLAPVLPRVLEGLRSLFDVSADSAEIHARLESMGAVKPGTPVLGTRVPGSFAPFETAARATLGQLVSVKAANGLAAKMAEAFGPPARTPFAALRRHFPSPEETLALGEPLSASLGPLGISASKARAISGLARAFLEGTVDFSPASRPEAEIAKLTAIPGVGPWTAKYIAMRVMGWTDAFLETDRGVLKALAPLSSREALLVSLPWRPWRSYATLNLWNSLKEA
ncbi:MAG: helix-turn-helix domain-containing protein [Deltaproteobacteria bacterium]|jgi:AraC family transcriptional regulator of adaptative response / DNA-3-methyladenine glycosylase II|nr:helix-turn-helix domain-containing protein [Deltaproteobacteria bacterium]